MKKMTKGKYYIGDPCYIFEESWMDVLNETHFFRDDKLKGKDICGGGTAYGDGSYYDNQGREYAVDAGIIAILPVSMLKIDNKETLKSVRASEYMHILEFKKDFECSAEDGIFTFGDIVINTKDEECDETCPHCGGEIH